MDFNLSHSYSLILLDFFSLIIYFLLFLLVDILHLFHLILPGSPIEIKISFPRETWPSWQAFKITI